MRWVWPGCADWSVSDVREAWVLGHLVEFVLTVLGRLFCVVSNWWCGERKLKRGKRETLTSG